jgi:hypothetical protein
MSLICPINGARALPGARCPRRCPVNGKIAPVGAVCPLGHRQLAASTCVASPVVASAGLVCPVNGAVARLGARCPRRCPVNGKIAPVGAVCPLGHRRVVASAGAVYGSRLI